MDKEKNAIWYPELDIEQKEDIYGKIDEIQIESGVWLITNTCTNVSSLVLTNIPCNVRW